MFKNILDFWKNKDFLSNVISEFSSMLEDSHIMYSSAMESLFQEHEAEGLKDEIYRLDRKVNDSQKNIRKRIVEHLSVQPSADLIACLILMSVVKDAERIGDFAKNIYEIRELMGGPLSRERYREYFDILDEEIKELFDITKAAFIESDKEKAAASWDYQRKIKTHCKEIIKEVVKSGLPLNEAVSFAIMARYFIRISSHLTNIATSVIVPLDSLDYFDEQQA